MESNNWIKTYVIQILPALAFFVYIIGFAYYIVYYYQFGINVISYITLTEVLVSTLVPLTIVTVISVSLFSFNFIFRNAFKPYKIIFTSITKIIKRQIQDKKYTIYLRKIKNKLQLIDEHYKKKELEENHYSSVLWTSILFSIICGILPLYIYMDKIKVDNKSFIIIFLLSGIIFAINTYHKVYTRIKSDIVKFYHNIVSLIIVFITILFCSIRLGIHNAQHDKDNSKRIFCIYTVNNLEYTNKDYNYIGECGSAIFLYQKIMNNTIILNKANIVSSIYDTAPSNIYKELIEDFKKDSRKQKKLN